MKIGKVDLSKSVLVIAEIGNNHEGDPTLAAEMIHAASDAGADAVKFQTFAAEHYVRRSDRERFAMLSRFQLSVDDYVRLSGIAQQEGLLFLSTAFDLGSVSILKPLVDAFKIASGDITFIPLLEAVGETNKPVILSTGASSLEEVEAALRVIGPSDRCAVLHCTSAYPTPDEDVNLSAIKTLEGRFGGPVGLSDHTLGSDAALAAVAIGARIIEKHFTLDREQSKFRDHALSADPQQFRDLVQRIRATELRLGDGTKQVQPSERDTRMAIRRSIAAARDLPRGTVLSSEDLTWVRPGNGLPPGDEQRVLGSVLRVDLAQGDHILLECLEDAVG